MMKVVPQYPENKVPYTEKRFAVPKGVFINAERSTELSSLLVH